MPWYNSIGGGAKHTAANMGSKTGCNAATAYGALNYIGSSSGKTAPKKVGFAAAGSLPAPRSYRCRFDKYKHVMPWAGGLFQGSSTDAKRSVRTAHDAACKWSNTEARRLESAGKDFARTSATWVGKFEEQWNRNLRDLSKLESKGLDEFAYTGNAFSLWLSSSERTGKMLDNLVTELVDVLGKSDHQPTDKLLGRIAQMKNRTARVCSDDFLVNVIALELREQKRPGLHKKGNNPWLEKTVVGAIQGRSRAENELNNKAPLGAGQPARQETISEAEAEKKAEALFAKAEKLDPQDALEDILALLRAD